jgi:shikimate 5-dehydrogenase
MFKWIEIATENNKIRYETLSKVMTENGFANSVDFAIVKTDELSVKLPEILEKYDGIRVGRGLGELIVPYFQGNPVLVNQIQAADAIIKKYNKWSLLSNAVDGLSRVLASFGEHLDLSSSALIVGTGAASKVAITALFRIGFKKFAISSLDPQKVENMIEELKRTLFGVHFQLVPKEGLILLPGTHGVLVNTTPMTSDNPLLNELYYFNFFKQGGIAIDFTILPVETPVIIGAKEIGALAIYGHQICAYTDQLWFEQISGLTFPIQKYSEELRSALTKN